MKAFDRFQVEGRERDGNRSTGFDETEKDWEMVDYSRHKDALQPSLATVYERSVSVG